MNAPANIQSSRRDAYAQTIAIFCPGIDECEMEYRVEIAMIRDKSAVGAQRASQHASVFLSEVCRMATAAVYAPAPVSRLILTRSTLMFLMEAARAAECLSRDG
jgi:hypothetical protein